MTINRMVGHQVVIALLEVLHFSATLLCFMCGGR